MISMRSISAIIIRILWQLHCLTIGIRSSLGENKRNWGIGMDRKMMRRILNLFLLPFLLLVACQKQTEQDESADTIYLGGAILTMVQDQPVAEALAVKDGLIQAVFDEDDLELYQGKKTKLIDLKGQTLMPGFFQSHAHFSYMTFKDAAVNLDPPAYGTVDTMDKLITALKERALETLAGSAIVGMGYDDTVIAEKRHPTRHDLDKVSTDHPIVLIHISGHFATMNTLALEMAGVAPDTQNPAGGVIRRETGSTQPDGVLEEGDLQYAMKIIGRPNPAQALKGFTKGLDKLLALGVTTAVDHATDPETELGLAAYYSIVKRPVDMVAYRRVTPGQMDDSGISKTFKNGNRVGGWKVVLDGSLQGYTGFLKDPYFEIPEGKPDTYRGYANMTEPQLNVIVEAAFEKSIPLLVHTNGDAATDWYLDAVRAAREKHPEADIRPVLIHAQTMREDQIEEAASMDMIASFFVDHVYYWGDRHRDIFLGPDRAKRISATRSAINAGLRYTLHDDAPVVPPSPLHSVWSAVNRQTSSGKILGGDQALTVTEALRGVTLNPAYQHFEEASKGSLEVGKRADMIILDQNPMTINPTEIKNIKVMTTIKDGKTVYVYGENAQ